MLMEVGLSLWTITAKICNQSPSFPCFYCALQNMFDSVIYCFYHRLGRLLVVSSIVGFGSRTSSNQVIMQCYCFRFTAGGSGVPQCRITVICVELQQSYFDESFYWSNADWICSTLDYLLLISIGLQQYRRKQQCHGCLPGLFKPLDMFKILGSLLNVLLSVGFRLITSCQIDTV